MGFKVSHYYYIVVSFTFYVCLYLLYIFRCFDVICYKHIFLWTLYPLVGFSPLSLCSAPFCHCFSFCIKVYFVWYDHCCPSFNFFFLVISFFPSSHFQSMCIFNSKFSFTGSMLMGRFLVVVVCLFSLIHWITLFLDLGFQFIYI